MSSRKQTKPGSVCPICGTKIEQNPKGTKAYCSLSCRQKAYHRRKDLTPIEKMIKRNEINAVCVQCGTAYHRRRKDGLYCSIQCKEKARTKRNREAPILPE